MGHGPEGIVGEQVTTVRPFQRRVWFGAIIALRPRKQWVRHAKSFLTALLLLIAAGLAAEADGDDARRLPPTRCNGTNTQPASFVPCPQGKIPGTSGPCD
jgi:hypothetical protein